jgi:transcriptional regulator with XRE-family HTH domain
MLGERLRAARMMAGLSQQELADNAQVSKMAISKYERDKMVPSSGVLLRISEALGREVEYFLRPIRVKVAGAVHRERAGRAERDRQATYARVGDCLERYLEIETILGMQGDFELPQCARPAESFNEAESLAEDLRGEWQLGEDAIKDLTKLLEDQGIKVCAFPSDSGFHALLLRLEDETPVVAVRDGLRGDRLRFSLAHELGHLVMGHAAPLTGEQDQLAHRFAAAFLVPAVTARRELAAWGPLRPLAYLIALKEQYGLSVQAWVWRAKELGIITEAEADRLLRGLGRDRKKELGPTYPPERPRRMEILVGIALTNDVISRNKAAELLGNRMADIASWLEQLNEVPAGQVCS